MLTKRIIPCLDIKDGIVVKGTNFSNLKTVADPVLLAKKYNADGADEIVFYDITASHEQRSIFTHILEKVAGCIFIPLTVGGAINSTDDFARVLAAGADKVSVNSGAISNPKLIETAAAKYGSQCVVLSVDIKRENGYFAVFAKGGRERTGIDAIEWIKQGVSMGAGEVVVNSIDTDGVKNGFDLELLAAVDECVNVPIVASGGAGNMQHFYDLFSQIPNISAGLAASIFHRDEIAIQDLKNYLHNYSIPIRMV